jgi:asparagine synthetase B (glutamine-hydrolysing)
MMRRIRTKLPRVRCHLIRLGRPEQCEALAERVSRAALSSLPVHPRELQTDRWASQDGTAHLWSWSNESSMDPLQVVLGDGVLVTTGYMRRHVGAGLATVPADQDEELAGLGGIWSIAHVERRQVVAASSFAGIEGWFCCSPGDGDVWIGSRALLVHLAARRSSQPCLDHIALAGMVNSGYMVSDRTPYEGTRFTGAGTVWSASLGGADRLPDVQQRLRRRPDRTSDTTASGVAVADALRSAATALPTDGSIRFGLTGGRDSRLILAALIAAGNEVTTFTRGPEESADVVVARRVADALGVGHERVDTKGAKGVAVEADPRLRIRNAVVLCDGQISAFDATGGAGTAFSSTRLALSGSGGEVLRGGYAKIHAGSRNPLAGVRWLRDNALFPATQLLDPGLVKAYEADVAHWVEAVETNPLQGLFDFYLEQRAARWFGASRLGTALAANARTLFLDDDVLAACFAAPLDALANERIIKEAMAILQPRLLDVPFVGKRLICDKARPKDLKALLHWEETAPVPATNSGVAGFTWRLHYGSEVAEVLDEAVVTSSLDGFFRADHSEIVPPQGSDDAAVACRAWHAATAASLTQPSYYEGDMRYIHRPELVLVTPRPTTRTAELWRGLRSTVRFQLRCTRDLLRSRFGPRTSSGP